MRVRMKLRVAAIGASLALTMASVALSTPPATAGTGAPPAPPANLRVTDLHPTGFTLAWDPVRGAIGYEVWGYRVSRLTTTGLTATYDRLLFDTSYTVFVTATVPGYFGLTSKITVTTPLPDGYQPPSAPTNLRIERNALGELERFRWDASTGGYGTLTYLFHVEIPPFLSAGVWIRTTGLTADAIALPLCDGCEYIPNQTVIVWVTATDRRYTSPPSERIELTCCPP